jgi:AraC-like DNA-binding protein
MVSQAAIDRGITWYLPQICDLRLMKARYIRHAFRPHAHDYWVLGIVETGLQSFTYRKKRLVTSPGSLILINPGEVHTGEAAVEYGFKYRALYPPLELMTSIADEFSTRPSRIPILRGGVVDDPALFHRIRRLHRRSEEPSSILQLEDNLICFLVDLIRQYATTGYRLKQYKQAPKEINLVCEYMHAHYAENVTLSDLSKLVHISPYHLARLFKRHTNMTPHKYLENVRIRQAEQLLVEGLPIVEVAISAGFSSQSHLTRTFKSFMGTTPGDFVKNRKII